MSNLLKFLVIFSFVHFNMLPLKGQTWPVDLIYPEIKTLRIAVHVFNDSTGEGNFQQNSIQDVTFINDVVFWVNYKLSHLLPIDPPEISAYVPDARIQIRLDTIFFHNDQKAWDCSDNLDGWYMREKFIDGDSLLSFRLKYQTLPVLLGGNHNVIGGFASNLGDKLFIAIRGFYNVYLKQPRNEALEECGKNLIHELGHSLGLGHNFQGGPSGDQCDFCEDNGCPVEGSSNNIMDYWPNYGHAISVCQLEFMHEHLDGKRGNISEVLINDSCYISKNGNRWILEGETLQVFDTLYLHGDLYVKDGAQIDVQGYLSMPQGSTIFLEPGAILNINHGTIGNLCGDLWNGIVGIGSHEGLFSFPHVVMAEACIENAFTGIQSETGIWLNISSSVFRNNVTAISVSGYPADTLYLDHCLFVTDGRLNHYDEGIAPEVFIRIEGVPMVLLNECELVNEAATFVFSPEWLGKGCLQTDGNLQCIHSTFSNLSLGVLYHSDHVDDHVRFVHCKFNHNITGIGLSGSAISSIRDCEFSLQRYDSRVSVGIMAESNPNILIKNNLFDSFYGSGEQTGIWLRNAGETTSLISGNHFKNLPAGILVTENRNLDSILVNADASSVDALLRLELGPQFRANDFIETPLQLGYMDDLGFGIALGRAFGAAPSYRSGLSWPAGGVIWYQDQIPFTGLSSSNWIIEKPAFHLMWFNNFSALSDTVVNVDWYLKMLNPTIFQTDLNLLQNYLNPSWILPSNKDAFYWIKELNRLPQVARASHMESLWSAMKIEHESWLYEEVSEIAIQRSDFDLQLLYLSSVLAIENEAKWSGKLYQMQKTNIQDQGYNLDSLAIVVQSRQWPQLIEFMRPSEIVDPLPGFFVYPNPSADIVKIHPAQGYLIDKGWQIKVYDNNGVLFYERTVNEATGLAIETQGWASGVYLIQVFSEKGDLGCVRFIKAD